MRLYLTVATSIFACFAFKHEIKYEPNWESLDTRPLPQWFDDAKFGIFIHWGPYSVPGYSHGFSSEWIWYKWKTESEARGYMKNNFKPNFSYQEFAKDFTAEFFDPNEWAELFYKSGAKYVVLTSKHLDGFTLWPSKYSFNWNAMDVGPHRDLVGDLEKAVKNKGLHYGLFYSLREWYNPLDLEDIQNKYKTDTYVENKVYPELVDIVNKYKPDIIWADGDQRSIPEDSKNVAYSSYWRAQKYFAWLYNESPVRDSVVVNDRWGKDVPIQHGDFFTNDTDMWIPKEMPERKWESCWTIDKKSFGYRRHASLEDFHTTKSLLKLLIQIVSGNGNFLLNVGPTKEGIITPIFQERLLSMGRWLKINGEAIYGTRPWKVQKEKKSDIWYTSKSDAVYAISTKWPKNGALILKSVNELFTNKSKKLKLLGASKTLKWIYFNGGIKIILPNKTTVKSVFCWVVKIPIK